MDCVIFGASPVKEKPALPQEAVLLAADAGWETLHRFGLTPDAVIGDFDSLGYIPEAQKVTVLPTRKDETDLFACVQEGLRRGCTRFHLFGATGGSREDHSFANLQLLLYLHRRGCSGILYFPQQKALLLDGTSLLEGSGTLSLFALFPCHVTLRGLEYTLEDAVLSPEFPLGVSNAFLKNERACIVTDAPLLAFMNTEASVLDR